MARKLYILRTITGPLAHPVSSSPPILAEGVGEEHTHVLLHGARAVVGSLVGLFVLRVGEYFEGHKEAGVRAINRMGYVIIGSGGVESG